MSYVFMSSIGKRPKEALVAAPLDTQKMCLKFNYNNTDKTAIKQTSVNPENKNVRIWTA
jgi:hypothetical protein